MHKLQTRRRAPIFTWITAGLLGCLAWALSACTARSQIAADPSQLVVTGVIRPAGAASGTERLVVVFLDAREIGRSIAPCGPGGCPFRVVIPNTYGLVGQGREPGGAARLEMGQLGEAEPRTFEAPVLPTERGRTRHVYAVFALAGSVAQLPPEFHTGRLGMLPNGRIVVITERLPTQTSPGQPAQLPPFAIAASILLASLACFNVTVAVIAGVVLILSIRARQRRALD